jgi:hypothetical protein
MDKVAVRDLRLLILGLEDADGDVLKQATFLDRIKFRLQQFRDPQLKRVNKDLKDKEQEIDYQGKALRDKIQEVKKRHRNLDFEGAAQSTREVQQIAKDMLPKAEEAEAKSIEIGERVMGRQHYTAKERKDTEVRREMLEASPSYVLDLVNKVAESGDVPFNQTHLAKYGAVDIKNVPYGRFLDAVRDAVLTRSMTIGRDADDLANQIDQHSSELLQNFQDAIRNGKVNWYDVADVSKEVPNRPVGQMRVVVTTPEILLPGDTTEENIYVHPSRVYLTELVNRKLLSLYGIQSMIMTGYQQPAVQPPPVEEPEPSTEEEPVIANRFWKLQKLGAEEFMKEREQEGPLVKAIKRALLKEKLPTTRVVVELSRGVPFEYLVRYAQVLSTALRVELDAECSIHNDRNKIEVEADLSGSQDLVKQAVVAISNGVTDAFRLSSGVKVDTHVYPGIKSKYALIEPDVVETSFRKVAMKTWSR